MAVNEDVTRLPKWAQQKISTLERNVEYWRGKAIAGEDGQSDTFLVHGWTEDAVKPLGDRPTIRFFIPRPGSRAEELEARIKDGELQVRCNDGVLSVVPHSSNLVCISSVDYLKKNR